MASLNTYYFTNTNPTAQEFSLVANYTTKQWAHDTDYRKKYSEEYFAKHRSEFRTNNEFAYRSFILSLKKMIHFVSRNEDRIESLSLALPEDVGHFLNRDEVVDFAGEEIISYKKDVGWTFNEDIMGGKIRAIFAAVWQRSTGERFINNDIAAIAA